MARSPSTSSLAVAGVYAVITYYLRHRDEVPYPRLTREDIRAALAYAADLVAGQETIELEAIPAR
jgi:hypothetical protein